MSSQSVNELLLMRETAIIAYRCRLSCGSVDAITKSNEPAVEKC